MIVLLTAAFAGNDPDFDLRRAVEDDDVVAAKRLLGEGVNPDGSLERRLLLHATSRSLRNDTGMVQLLLDAGADPNIGLHGHHTILKNVMQTFDRPRGETLAEQLIDAGALTIHRERTLLAWYRGDDPDRVVELGLRVGIPLDQLVCDASDAALLGRLLDRGADASAACWGTPPLLRAVISQDADRVDRLLAAGVDPAQPGMWERVPATALHVAAGLDWTWGLDRFLTEDAEVNLSVGAMGSPPLSVAKGSARLRLVEAGALRVKPHANPAMWTARDLEPTEVLPYLEAVLKHETTPVLTGWEGALDDAGRAWLSSRVVHLRKAPTAVGLTSKDLERARAFVREASCPIDDRHPTLWDVKDVYGKPSDKVKEGVIRTWTFDDGVVARGWHRGLRNRVMELHNTCGEGVSALIGVHRGAVWMALEGRPKHVRPDQEHWTLPGPLLWYVDGRLTGVGTAFR